PQTLCALVLALLLPDTTFPISPESATVLLASRALRPALLPRASGRLPARCAPPTLSGSSTTAGREGGSADWTPGVLPVGELPLAPGAHPPTQQGLRFILRGEIPGDQCHVSALAEGDGLHGIAVGCFPLPCLDIVHTQLRKDG